MNEHKTIPYLYQEPSIADNQKHTYLSTFRFFYILPLMSVENLDLKSHLFYNKRTFIVLGLLIQDFLLYLQSHGI